MIRIILLFLLCPLTAFSQHSDTLQQHKKVRQRVLLLSGTTAAVYGASLTGLHLLWYQDQPRTDFHFFNDNRQWQQVDKAGHFYTAFQISRIGYAAFRRTGMNQRKALWIGGSLGALLLSPVEIFDGFSPAYGASAGDLVANFSGSLLFIGQQLAWKECRIYPKYSFHPTPFAAQRPGTLGKGLHEQMLKDYNGHTYWLGFHLKSFFPRMPFPKWLNLAVGYGATNMLYSDDEKNKAAGLLPYRRYFIAPDLNLSHLHTSKKWLNTLLFFVDMVHLPAPALELNRKGIRLHGLYF